MASCHPSIVDDKRSVAIHSVSPRALLQVLALKAPGAGSEMDLLANATAGSVQTTDSESSEIVDAILEVRFQAVVLV